MAALDLSFRARVRAARLLSLVLEAMISKMHTTRSIQSQLLRIADLRRGSLPKMVQYPGSMDASTIPKYLDLAPTICQSSPGEIVINALLWASNLGVGALYDWR